MGQEQSKFDFSNGDELAERIQKIRDSALKTIDDYNKKYMHVEEGVSCFNAEELKLFCDQIKNKMLLVAIVGEGSSGKSTLINAFLGEIYLPVGNGPVTSLRIFIGHNPNVHKNPCESSDGCCDKCPYLVKGIGKHDNVLCRGVKDVKSKIAEENKKDENQNEPLVLYTRIPVFESLNLKDCTPYLVDSPGVEVITNDVQSYYSILSVMIYVENYLRLLHNKENIKTELGFKPKDASLLFAVSHFDKYYTSCPDEENPDEEETKDKVASKIQLVKREEVFPVCGKWALRARLAKKYKEKDENSCSFIEEAYRKAPNKKSDDSNLSITAKAACVLNASVFETTLEKTLESSICGTDLQQWEIMMCKQCETLLKGPIEAGDAVLKEIQSKIEFDSEKITRVKENSVLNENVLEELEKNIQQSSSASIPQKVEESMRLFHSSHHIDVKRYGDFMREWNEFKKHNISDVLNTKLNDEVESHVQDLKPKLQEEYDKLVNFAQDHDSQSASFTVEDKIRKVDVSFIGEPSEDIKGFVSSKTQGTKLWNSVRGLGLTGAGALTMFKAGAGATLIKAGVSAAVAKTAVAGAAVAKAGGLVAGAATLAAPAIPFVIGTTAIGGGVIYLYKAYCAKDDDVELNEEEVKTLYDKVDRNTKKSASKIEEDLVAKAVKETLADYNKSLKDKYDKEWKSKLNKKLEKAEELLAAIRNEESKLIQALDELKKYNEIVKAKINKFEDDGDN